MTQRILITLGGGYSAIFLRATPAIAAAAQRHAVDLLVESRSYGAASLLSGWDAVNSIYLRRDALRARESGRGYDAVLRTVGNRGRALGLGPETPPGPAKGFSEIERNMAAVRALGYDGPTPAMHVETDLPSAGLPKKFLAMAPGGSQRWKGWQDFCDMAHKRMGRAVLLVGAEDEIEPWMTRTKRWMHNYCGRTSIRGAAGIVSQCTQLVAADNAVALMGEALDRPVTVVRDGMKLRPLLDALRGAPRA